MCINWWLHGESLVACYFPHACFHCMTGSEGLSIDPPKVCEWGGSEQSTTVPPFIPWGSDAASRINHFRVSFDSERELGVALPCTGIHSGVLGGLFFLLKKRPCPSSEMFLSLQRNQNTRETFSSDECWYNCTRWTGLIPGEMEQLKWKQCGSEERVSRVANLKSCRDKLCGNGGRWKGKGVDQSTHSGRN